MTVVVEMHRCEQCGKPARKVDLQLCGEHIAHFFGCAACGEQTQDELARVRPVFYAMIAAGVSRELANDTMTFLIDRFYAESIAAAKRGRGA